MRQFFVWLTCILTFIDLAAKSEAYILGPSGPSDTGEFNFANTTTWPQGELADPTLTVTGRIPSTERPLPTLPPTEFSDCVRETVGSLSEIGYCGWKLDMEKHAVLEKCLDRSSNTAPPTIIQACTASLDHNILRGRRRFYLLINRANAYFVQGDKRGALNDYNEAIRLAPTNAGLYYNRGVFYGTVNEGDAALSDFDAALRIEPQLVPALHERAKIYKMQRNLRGAISDYSEAIRLQPNTAALWSERGLLYLLQRDYQSAVKDEAKALRLDPTLSSAYLFRGSAYGGLGDEPHARNDLVTAVRLDPSLQRYVTSTDRSSSDAHPP